MPYPKAPLADVPLGMFAGYQRKVAALAQEPDLDVLGALTRHRAETVGDFRAALGTLVLEECGKEHDDLQFLPGSCIRQGTNVGCGHGMEIYPDGRIGGQRLLWDAGHIVTALGQAVPVDDLVDWKEQAPDAPATEIVAYRTLELQVLDRSAIRGYAEFRTGAERHQVFPGISVKLDTFRSWIYSVEREHGGFLLKLRDRLADAFDHVMYHGDIRA
ncbi:MAG TPA: hypothetical protein PKV72_01090 [Candidatus Peribacteria bacterium]|nr:hypothetical protein [Candidatus Peribacteria bacterium]